MKLKGTELVGVNVGIGARLGTGAVKVVGRESVAVDICEVGDKGRVTAGSVRSKPCVVTGRRRCMRVEVPLERILDWDTVIEEQINLHTKASQRHKTARQTRQS
jgi:hypothetical protein